MRYSANRFVLSSAALLTLSLVACRPDVECEDAPPDNPFKCAEDEPDHWYWIPIEGARCRDSSAAGVGARLQGKAEKLVIFLQGGGGCYDANTCNSNRPAYGMKDFAGFAGLGGRSGIFDSGKGANPFRDWDMVFVPYCTGDLHWGDVSGVAVPGGPGEQRFVGHGNMAKILELIGPYFSGVSEVLLTGSSAGGYGTLVNYPQVATAFHGASVSLVDDCAPLFADNSALAPCLQELWGGLWGLDQTLPSDCADCMREDGDGLAMLYPHLSSAFPEGNFGLISFQRDLVIRAYLGDGMDDCSSTQALSAEVHEAGLFDLRDSLLGPSGRWSTFFPAGAGHTTLGGAGFYNRRVDGTSVAEWAAGVVEGRVVHLAEPR